MGARVQLGDWLYRESEKKYNFESVLTSITSRTMIQNILFSNRSVRLLSTEKVHADGKNEGGQQ